MKSLTVLLASLFFIVAGTNAEDASPQSGQSSNIVTKDNLVIIALATGPSPQGGQAMHTITILDTDTMESYYVIYSESKSLHNDDWTFRSLEAAKEAAIKKD